MKGEMENQRGHPLGHLGKVGIFNYRNGTVGRLLVKKSVGSLCLRRFTLKHLMMCIGSSGPGAPQKEQDVEWRRADSWNLLPLLRLPITASNHGDLQRAMGSALPLPSKSHANSTFRQSTPRTIQGRRF